EEASGGPGGARRTAGADPQRRRHPRPGGGGGGGGGAAQHRDRDRQPRVDAADGGARARRGDDALADGAGADRARLRGGGGGAGWRAAPGGAAAPGRDVPQRRRAGAEGISRRVAAELLRQLGEEGLLGPPMPEYPDVTVYLEALAPRILGQPLEGVRVRGPSLVRTADPPLRSAFGKRVVGLRRVGVGLWAGL